MPPSRTPKSDFYERGRKLLKDSANSTNPELAKIRLEMGKRYFDADLRGDAKVSPTLAFTTFGVIVLILFATIVYCANNYSRITTSVSCFFGVFLTLVLLLAVFALTGIMKENGVIKIFSKLIDRVMTQLSALKRTKPASANQE